MKILVAMVLTAAYVGPATAAPPFSGVQVLRSTHTSYQLDPNYFSDGTPLTGDPLVDDAYRLKLERIARKKYEQKQRDIARKKYEQEQQELASREVANSIMAADEPQTYSEQERSRSRAANSTPANRGAINVQTGEYLVPAGNGYVGAQTGQYYPSATVHPLR